MSLEAAVKENTETMKALIQVLSGMAQMPPTTPGKTQPAPTSSKPAAAKQTETPAKGEIKGNAVTLEMVQKIVPELVTKAGRPVAVALLAKYDAKTATQVKPENFAAFHAEAKQAIADAQQSEAA